jgi:hypothetical protein
MFKLIGLFFSLIANYIYNIIYYTGYGTFITIYWILYFISSILGHVLPLIEIILFVIFIYALIIFTYSSHNSRPPKDEFKNYLKCFLTNNSEKNNYFVEKIQSIQLNKIINSLEINTFDGYICHIYFVNIKQENDSENNSVKNERLIFIGIFDNYLVLPRVSNFINSNNSNKQVHRTKCE